MSDDPDEKLMKLEEFKLRNIATLLEWEKLTADARTALFKSLCHKPYLTACEPEYCGFRITGVCKYPEELTKLKDKMSIP